VNGRRSRGENRFKEGTAGKGGFLETKRGKAKLVSQRRGGEKASRKTMFEEKPLALVGGGLTSQAQKKEGRNKKRVHRPDQRGRVGGT